MNFYATILSEAEQEACHQQSLRILEQIGVRFHGEKALPLLEKHGARVNWETRVAQIPPELVSQALGSAPRQFTLGARNPQYRFPMPSPVTRYCTDGTAAFVIDFHSAERRYGTRQDIEQAMRIFQQMELGMMAWAPNAANDAPSGARALHEFFGMAQHCSKHGQHELHTAAQVPFLVEGLSAITGSEEQLKARKDYSLIYCPVAPLTHDGEMLDTYLALGEVEMPVMLMPMPVCGTTGPASLFSNIALAHAENLSAIVVFQLAHPGRWLIYSSATGIVDFTTGAFLGGVPEMGLMSAALTRMGRFVDLPTTAAGCTADAKEPGAQAVIEKLLTTLPPLMVGADLIIGTGEVDGDQVLVLEQLVVDNELGRMCQRLVEGVDCSTAKDLYDDILQVGPGGHFLKARSTRQAARSSEFAMSRLFPRSSYETWAAANKPEMYGLARQKVEEILSAPPVDVLAEEVTARLAEILRKADEIIG